jgi:hypothetical protein
VGHRFDVLDEVPGQPQAERQGLVDGVTGLLRERRTSTGDQPPTTASG